MTFTPIPRAREMGQWKSITHIDIAGPALIDANLVALTVLSWPILQAFNFHNSTLSAETLA